MTGRGALRRRVDDGGSPVWTRVRGLSMHARVVDEAPTAADDVVLLHGLGVSGRYMLPLARELAPHFRLHIPDLPGFGRSGHPSEVLDVPGLAAWLLDWVDAVGLRELAMVANSLGCQVAVEAMTQRAGAFCRAVLVGPTFDRRGRHPLVQVARLARTAVHERPSLAGVVVGDYRASGVRRALATAHHGLAHRLEEKLPSVAEPVLVVRGGRDAVVPQRWAREVTEALPLGRLAVVGGGGHTLNYSAPGPLAAAILPFLGGPAPGPDAPTARAAAKSIADFDSGTAVLRAAVSSLERRDLPAIGAVPRAVVPLAERVLPAVNALPAPLREWLYRTGSGGEAVPPELLHTVSAEAVARWMVEQYPRRQYPAAIIGSSGGALAHLAAALDVPFLPQTFLLPVAQPPVHPDDPRHGLHAGLGPGRMLLDANPDVALHHMHDPNQDRLSLARMTYFRLKRRRLGPAFTDFLTGVLPRGATLLVADCRLQWPVTHIDDRHVFQFGALGGMPPEEFHHGSDRIADYLRRYGSARRRWDPPAPDRQAAEAEWGFDPALMPDLHDLADRHGWRLRRVVFDGPEDLSPVVAELYRWWYRRRGLPADRLLVESFVLLDPTLTLRTGSVPYWSTFPVDASADALEQYLAGTTAYDDIRMTLFNHGTRGVGVTPVERWRRILEHARTQGAFLGVDPGHYPRDFASFVRFHRDLRDRPQSPPPDPLRLTELDEFLADHAEQRPQQVRWC